MVASTTTKKEYKQTEVGLIPEDWEIRVVSDISEVKTGPFGSALHEKDYVNVGTPIITVEHLGEHGILHENMPLVSNEDKVRLKAYSLKPGDIVFSRVGSVDRNALVQESEDGWLYSGRLLRVRPKLDQVHPNFLSFHFHTNAFKQRVKDVAVGQTMASINTKILKGIKIILPSTTKEQNTIATALLDIDNHITLLEMAVVKKRNIKTATMQELLTGTKRLAGFRGRWEKTKLGDLLAYEQPTQYLVRSTKYNDSYDTPVLTAGKTFILGYTDETTGIFKDVPVIIFDDFTTANKYVTFPFKAKSSAMKMLRPKNKEVNMRFVFEKMQLIDFKLGDHKRYWISEYQNLELDMPKPDEQTAIASVLSDMDNEINGLKDRLKKTRELKQGMMQQLLTGSIRLI